MGQDRTITINNNRFTFETREVPTFTINKLRETELESPARRGHWQKFEHGIHVRSRDETESRNTDQKNENVAFYGVLLSTEIRKSIVFRHNIIIFYIFQNFSSIFRSR